MVALPPIYKVVNFSLIFLCYVSVIVCVCVCVVVTCLLSLTFEYDLVSISKEELRKEDLWK